MGERGFLPDLKRLLGEAERMRKVQEEFIPVPASWHAAAVALVNAAPDLIGRLERVEKALELAEDVLSRSPFSTQIWPNGMHPNAGITIIRAALQTPERENDHA